jgi:hypothetical protein
MRTVTAASAGALGLGVFLAVSGCGPKATPNSAPVSSDSPAPTKPTSAPEKKVGPGGAAQPQGDAVARFRVVINLQHMAFGLSNFSDNSGDRLPPADGSGVENQFDPTRPRTLSGLSWRVAALNFMTSDKNQPGQEKDIYTKLRDGKYAPAPGSPPADRWNVPELKGITLDPFSCPVPGRLADPWLTYSRVFIGNGAAFEPNKRLSFADFTDGQDKTILVVEAGEAVPWPKPEELPYDPAKPLPKLGGMFADGFYAAFADGRVRFIKHGTDEKLLRAWITRNGKEPVTELPPPVDMKALRTAAGYSD